jgi:hypothetical protein
MDNSKRYFLNLFNDFIINKIPDGETAIIKLVDVKNFIVVKGLTTLSTPLDLFTISKEFIDKNSVPENLKFNTIDLIEYSTEETKILSGDISILSNIKYKIK